MEKRLAPVVFLYSDYAIYDSDEPVFYQPEEYPTVQAIKQAYPVILSEVLPYIQKQRKIEAKNPNAPDVNYPNTWKHAYFMNYLWYFPKAKKMFPKTHDLLMQFSDITLAGIAVLEPGGKLLPHVGETNAIIRCHLGIKIPGSLPECGLRVKDQYRSWADGDVLCFNDAFNHEAWNLTKEQRYIMIFDIIRPEFAGKKVWICAYALGIASSRYFLQILGIKRPLPDLLRKIMVAPLAVVWWLYLHIQNRLLL